ncbi:hypothetical protein EDB83DRAFT_2658629 [Lactarius deliciosus]|nr:hypothetical protein EDB83DRAFT_2658629 [Lactarius deliciosus]
MVSVYNFDPSLGCGDATFQPCSPRAPSSLKVVGDRCKGLYPLGRNFKLHGRTSRRGFFAEDVFIGGHPQFFAAFNSAEQLYDAIHHLGRPDWIDRSHASFAQVLRAAFGFVLQLAKATPDDYVLLECLHNEAGEPYGPRGMVRDLASALTVIDAYKGLIPPNWGHPVQKSNEIPVGWPVNNAQAKRYRPSPDVYHQHTSYDGDTFRALATN